MTTPVTGEIEARRFREILAEEAKKQGLGGTRSITMQELDIFDRLGRAAISSMHRVALDRASADGVRVTDEMVDAALRAYHHFGPEIPVSGLGAGQTRMREALAAALSAGSIPTGDKNV